MQKSSILMLAITVMATFGVFLMPQKDMNLHVEEVNLYESEYASFKAEFNKKYELSEDAFRFRVFRENLERINAHNSDETQTYLMGVTQFADLTTEEFVERFLVNDLMSFDNIEVARVEPGVQANSSVDWRNKGVMTGVKNQGQCGSCWSFSTTATLESAVAVAGKGLNSFSEQQLVDCCGDKGYKCQGCQGAWPEWAMNYINAEGIVLEDEYKYTARKGACKATPTAKKYLNTQKPWTMLSGVSGIQQALSTTGPVSICIDASNWSLYRSGVFSKCGTTTLNHAVTAVGYDESGNWIVRNSWGTSWGEQGFIRLAPGGTCGIDKHPLIPNLA